MAASTSDTANPLLADGGRPAPAAPRPFLADVESWVMEARCSGRTYQISVALPDGYGTTEASWPVLYVTDANAEFGLAVETARLAAYVGEVPGLVIIGIGYPNPGQGFRASLTPRAFDLTPTCDPSASMPTGGAALFLSFLRDELIPLIERDFSVSTDRGLMGHSFGGLFATYALVAGAGLFGRFVIASPSIWWHDRSVLQMEETFATSGGPVEAKVFLGAGSRETTPSGTPMADDMTGLARRLRDRRYPRLGLGCRVFEGEGHVSVIGAAFSRGLRAVYGPSAPAARPFPSSPETI